jgi:hypothetical protein
MVLIQTPNTLFEEIGWRGYALPRMAGTLGWLRGSLVLGVIWAAWHLPYWLSAPNVHQYGPVAVALFFIMPVSGSVFVAWMYRSTGSLLLCWLWHLSTNTAIAFLPLASEQIGNLWPQALYTVLTVCVSLVAGLQLARTESSATQPSRSGQAVSAHTMLTRSQGSRSQGSRSEAAGKAAGRSRSDEKRPI